MKNEIVRWAKPPRLVPHHLVVEKDSISLWQYPWVYAAPLSMLATVPWWVLSLLWISGPFTLQAWGHLWFVTNTLVLILTACITLVRLVSPNGEPLSTETDAPLNFKGKKKLAQYERNRKRALQNPERRARYAETDNQYSQFSVWSEPVSNCVQLRIIEHVPRHIGPIVFKYSVRPAAHNGNVAVKWFEDPSLDELNHQFAEMELIAATMEESQYSKEISIHNNTRNALMVRR